MYLQIDSLHVYTYTSQYPERAPFKIQLYPRPHVSLSLCTQSMQRECLHNIYLKIFRCIRTNIVFACKNSVVFDETTAPANPRNPLNIHRRPLDVFEQIPTSISRVGVRDEHTTSTSTPNDDARMHNSRRRRRDDGRLLLVWIKSSRVRRARSSFKSSIIAKQTVHRIWNLSGRLRIRTCWRSVRKGKGHTRR